MKERRAFRTKTIEEKEIFQRKQLFRQTRKETVHLSNQTLHKETGHLTSAISDKLFREKNFHLLYTTFLGWRDSYRDRKMAITKLFRMSERRIKIDGFWELDDHLERETKLDIVRNALSIAYIKKIKDTLRAVMNKWKIQALDDNYL